MQILPTTRYGGERRDDHPSALAGRVQHAVSCTVESSGISENRKDAVRLSWRGAWGSLQRSSPGWSPISAAYVEDFVNIVEALVDLMLRSTRSDFTLSYGLR